MNPKGGGLHRRVAGAILLLAAAAAAILMWHRAAPPGPEAVLVELRIQHGIEFERKGRDVEWDFDKIATEWAWLVLARSSLSSGETPRFVELRGWRCSLRTPTEVDAGSVVLGSATVATGHGGTLTGRTPDGGFECEVTTTPGDGPHTFLLTAIPTGTIERLRFGSP